MVKIGRDAVRLGALAPADGPLDTCPVRWLGRLTGDSAGNAALAASTIERGNNQQSAKSKPANQRGRRQPGKRRWVASFLPRWPAAPVIRARSLPPYLGPELSSRIAALLPLALCTGIIGSYSKSLHFGLIGLPAAGSRALNCSRRRPDRTRLFGDPLPFHFGLCSYRFFRR